MLRQEGGLALEVDPVGPEAEADAGVLELGFPKECARADSRPSSSRTPRTRVPSGVSRARSSRPGTPLSAHGSSGLATGGEDEAVPEGDSRHGVGHGPERGPRRTGSGRIRRSWKKRPRSDGSR
ncbi:MAG: hypothetical protein MZU97_08160 [Bacillus subtilis]|nr:hypothetical protein [Bacillus subtilis]